MVHGGTMACVAVRDRRTKGCEVSTGYVLAGVIDAGTVVTQICSAMDLMPTLAELADVEVVSRSRLMA